MTSVNTMSLYSLISHPSRGLQGGGARRKGGEGRTKILSISLIKQSSSSFRFQDMMYNNFLSSMDI